MSPRQKEVILRRFALSALAFPGKGGAKRETLESIGKDLGITRERVRQIERDGFLRLKPEIKKYQKIFNYFKDCLKKTGNLRKEESLLLELAGRRLQSEEDKSSSLSTEASAEVEKKESSSTSPSLRESSMNEVYFLLTLGEDFERFGETKDFYSLWTIDQKSWNLAQKIINAAYEKFKKVGKPLKLEELVKSKFLSSEILTSYTELPKGTKGEKRFISSILEISKKIQRNAENFWGLKDWPEINPKRIKDKAYLVFKKEQKPLHFTQVANLIGLALPQTVHNELIKDSKFVLVGRGIYALKEWGYEEGVVKDVILNILKTAGRPLKKEEILEKTLKQRLVKENTVLLNLSNKKYFLRNSEGLYTIREA
ncbi:MAG: sigma factor-like helix-turn-helix DNA-binding protein [bacterium]|nr:sigma factor-like helix-turn-helix DNA-binding protein [bacterium]